MNAEENKPFVVADTSLLLNFLKIGRVDLLAAFYRIIITEHVRGEVTDPGHRTTLEEAIASGLIEESVVTDPGELGLFSRLNVFLDRGEAAAIAVAERRGWILGLDEKGVALREAMSRLGAARILNTVGVLVECIRRGVLSIEEADEIKDELARKRFVIKLGSFSELLGS